MGSLGLYQILPRVWYVRGKLGLAAEMLEGGIEAARLQGTPPALAGNLFNRSVVAVAVGDLDLGLATAQEAVEVTRELDEGFVTAWAAVRLANVLLETGQATRAVELLVGRAGGEELALIPGGWRAYCLELLTRCYISLDRPIEAERTAHIAEVAADARRLPLASAWAESGRGRGRTLRGGHERRYRIRPRIGGCRGGRGCAHRGRALAHTRGASPRPGRAARSSRRGAATRIGGARRLWRCALSRASGATTGEARPAAASPHPARHDRRSLASDR